MCRPVKNPRRQSLQNHPNRYCSTYKQEHVKETTVNTQIINPMQRTLSELYNNVTEFDPNHLRYCMALECILKTSTNPRFFSIYNMTAFTPHAHALQLVNTGILTPLARLQKKSGKLSYGSHAQHDMQLPLSWIWFTIPLRQSRATFDRHHHCKDS